MGRIVKKRYPGLKWLLILEIIIFYLSFLNVVSHVRGPDSYRLNTDAPLLLAMDFQSFSDMGISRPDSSLPLLNPTAGAAAGYQAELPLDDLLGVSVCFQIDCPEDEAGSTVTIDLYNFEAGYDSPEQETQVVLQAGLNEISTLLSPGESAPEQAQLRIFTLDEAHYEITGLEIWEQIRQPKITPGMVAVPIVVGALFLATLLMRWHIRRADATQSQSDLGRSL